MLGLEDLGQLLRGVDLIVHGQAGLAGVEGGQLLGLVAQDGDAVGLQILQGQLQIQDGLGPGADDHHVGLAQLFQVGGDIHGGLCAAMHAADAAGGEDLDARHVGDHHGGGHGGGAVSPLGDQHSQVPAGSLGHGLALLAQVLDLVLGQAGLQAAAQNGDGGGDCAVGTDDLLDLEGSLHVLGVGHPVGDDGGFQRHDGLALGQGLGNFGIHVKILIQVIHG